MRPKSHFLKLTALLLLSVSAALPVKAQEYPNRPIRLIVPFAPGGNTDVAGRLMATGMGAILGQSIVVENKGGAGATIGAGVAANAAPDGYTVLLASSALTISPAIYQNVPYDIVHGFAPIGQAMVTSLTLISSRKLGVNTLEELLQEARSNPGKLTYSSAGVGSGSHLAGVLFNRATEINAVHVPYKGSGPATNAILSGEVDYTFTSQAAALPLVEAERVTALAVTSQGDSPLFPGIPTVNAAAVKGYEAGDWLGLAVPAGTPQAVIDRLNAALVEWVSQPETKERLLQAGFEARPSSPDEFGELIKSELAMWADTVKLAGIEQQ